MIQDHIDILVIADTKLDASFPKNQFLIPGFKAPSRLDVSDKCGGLLVFVRDCLLSTEIKVDNMLPETQVIKNIIFTISSKDPHASSLTRDGALTYC